ncbi:ATP-binding protein [Kitasatospora sp. NBC_00240]|uniref:sensor histidine kinase n=1 Tax=Kitasatospora sp. NBC_00240 TaxID=2903567 RepID=UPI00225AE509|nr:ATP-binding protein [Kitasatospora sp. NBC_00240]MCX5215764.1 ATP-binding protein [Kitasatospora sp. NBC_00240]
MTSYDRPGGPNGSRHRKAPPSGTPATGMRSRLTRLALVPAATMTVLGATACAVPLLTSSPVLDAAAPAGFALGAVVVLAAAGRAARTLALQADATSNSREEAEQKIAHLTRQLQDARAAAVRAEGDHLVSVLLNLARRIQALVSRELDELDALELEVEDPELLASLFRVDHLVTRSRRHVESLAVLCGAVPRRAHGPVLLSTVLRQAVAEIEHYRRVRIVAPVECTVHGHAVADVVHLLAELFENATRFSPPDQQVTVRVREASAGLVVEVDDHGLGIPPERLAQVERVLAAPDDAPLGEQLRDGRIGLLVVARLARRHDVLVRLQPNFYGGTQALVLLPYALLQIGPGTAAVTPQLTPQPAVLTAPVTYRAPAGAGIAAGHRPPGHPIDAAPAPAARPWPAGVPQALPAGAPPVADGARPALPRRVGTHLAPQLYRQPASAEDAVVVPDTGLMARFADGVRRATPDPLQAHTSLPRSFDE